MDGGDMDVGDMDVGDMDGGDMDVGDMDGGDMDVGDMAVRPGREPAPEEMSLLPAILRASWQNGAFAAAK
jgi:hypothetical protein